jgi:hypothetical protein
MLERLLLAEACGWPSSPGSSVTSKDLTSVCSNTRENEAHALLALLLCCVVPRDQPAAHRVIVVPEVDVAIVQVGQQPASTGAGSYKGD